MLQVERLRGKQRRLFRFPRKLKVTREGKYFIGITLGVGFAAINTGNNLLYLVLGMLLSLIVVSSVMSELSLRKLSISRKLPKRAQVGRPHLVEIEVRNHKRRIPSYAIEVEDLRAGQPADKRCFFLKISPESAQIAAYRRSPVQRGRDRHLGFRVATRFPFGLFEKSREFDAEDELVIYPAVDAVVLPPRLPGRSGGMLGALGAGRGDEILSVRPHRDGDDAREIYWRKSTYREQLVARERATETRSDIQLALDVCHPGERAGVEWTRNFEKAIRATASRAVAHLKRGDTVNLRTSNGLAIKTDASAGADMLLRFLALLEAAPQGPSEGGQMSASNGEAA